ncbi:MAG TPA: DoxX family protein [Povalibacter sp.]|nr:DoxX family protein [Povalibacter sp.]
MTPTPYASVAPLIGRLLIGIFFIPSGLQKLGGFSGTAAYIASAGLPMPTVGVTIAILVEVLVGAMLLIGWKTRWAALILAVFCLVTAFFFHKYWSAPADQQMMQHINFYKNCAIAGGLLFVYAFGPGRYSLDERSRSP